MSLSLRDQLLKAGLVNEKQVQKVEQQQGRKEHGQKKGSLPPPPDRNAEARKAQAAMAARDQELERARSEKAERKARRAGIHQMVEQHRIPRIESEDAFNFVDAGKVRHIAVNPEVRARINNGELLVARHAGFYALVPKEIGERIRERDATMMIALAAAAVQAPAEDDPYGDFVVPDDLVW
ncbi:MAG: hypothetical protein RL684_2003 [Pseudomonadota bacterium]|jgi:uncharacterized protein YaiL (DUF2058 family)